MHRKATHSRNAHIRNEIVVLFFVVLLYRAPSTLTFVHLVHRRRLAKLFSARTSSAESSRPVGPTVQRKYEIYKWEHREEDLSQVYEINYRVEGEGLPLLLVHGFGANVNHFRFQFPYLATRGYKVYAIDLLGFGASVKPAISYSIELFTSLLHDFIESREEAIPWTVAGNSIGGLACLMLAQKVPESVDSVVLFNCAGGMSGFRYSDVPILVKPILFVIQNVILKGPIGPYFFQNFRSRANVESILKKQGVYGSTENVNEELLEILLRPADDEGACDVFLRVFGGPPGPTPESILSSLHCPILVFWGTADPWTPFDGGMHPGTDFPAFYFSEGTSKDSDFFQIELLEGAGHCPHDECPEVVNRKMVEWMASMKGRHKA